MWLYRVYEHACNVILLFLNIQIPWSEHLRPTVAQLLVFSFCVVLVVNAIKDLKY